MSAKVSLIIPCYNDHVNLQKQLHNIVSWKLLPNEIIIVDSSEQSFSIDKNTEASLKESSVNLTLIHKINLFPGHARNIGIKKSINDILAFIDSSTFPNSNWLFSGIALLKKNNTQGVWGKTFYEANTYKSKIIRAASYGALPIRTLPGSILKKDIFLQCGFFIESVRAGEDADWMSRVKLHQISIEDSSEFLSYNNLNLMKIFSLLKKWFRNYSFGAILPFYNPHRDIYLLIISLTCMIGAYNWNNLLASWDMNSEYYIPNITKISFSTLAMIYLLIRGFFIPLKKKVKFKFLLPINFLPIVAVSFLLDTAKLLAFIFSRRK